MTRIAKSGLGVVGALLLSAFSVQAIYIGNDLISRDYASDYPPGDEPVNVLVILDDSPLPVGQLDAFLTFNQSSGAAGTSSEGHAFYGYVFRPTGTANEYDVVFRTALLTVPASPLDAVVTYPVSFATMVGDQFGHFGSGVPVDVGGGGDILAYPTTTTAPIVGDTISLGSSDFPVYSEDRTYSIAVSMAVPDAGSTVLLLCASLIGLLGARRRIRA